MIILFVAAALGFAINAWLKADERADAAEAELRRIRGAR